MVHTQQLGGVSQSSAGSPLRGRRQQEAGLGALAPGSVGGEEPIRSERKLGAVSSRRGRRDPRGERGRREGGAGEGGGRSGAEAGAEPAAPLTDEGESRGERASEPRGRRGEAGARRGFARPPRVT